MSRYFIFIILLLYSLFISSSLVYSQTTTQGSYTLEEFVDSSNITGATFNPDAGDPNIGSLTVQVDSTKPVSTKEFETTMLNQLQLTTTSGSSGQPSSLTLNRSSACVPLLTGTIISALSCTFLGVAASFFTSTLPPGGQTSSGTTKMNSSTTLATTQSSAPLPSLNSAEFQWTNKLAAQIPITVNAQAQAQTQTQAQGQATTPQDPGICVAYGGRIITNKCAEPDYIPSVQKLADRQGRASEICTCAPTSEAVPLCTKADLDNKKCTAIAYQPCPANGDEDSNKNKVQDTNESWTGISTAIGCVPTQPIDFVNGFIKFISLLAGGVALLLMIWGAVQMITSAGDAERLKVGQQTFTSAIIGLLFVIFAILLMQIIGIDILGIPGLGRI